MLTRRWLKTLSMGAVEAGVHKTSQATVAIAGKLLVLVQK